MYLGQLEGGDPRIVCACCGLQNIPFGTSTVHSMIDCSHLLGSAQTCNHCASANTEQHAGLLLCNHNVTCDNSQEISVPTMLYFLTIVEQHVHFTCLAGLVERVDLQTDNSLPKY